MKFPSQIFCTCFRVKLIYGRLRLNTAQIIQALYKAEWWHEQRSEFDLLGSALLGLDNTLARSYGLWLWPGSSFVVEYNHACAAFPRSQGEQILFLVLFCCTMVLASFLSAVCIILALSYSISKCLYWKLIQRERSYIVIVWDTSHKHSAERLFQVLSKWMEKKFTLFSFILIVMNIWELLKHGTSQYFFGSISCWWWKIHMHFLCMYSLTPKAVFRGFALLKCYNTFLA